MARRVLACDSNKGIKIMFCVHQPIFTPPIFMVNRFTMVDSVVWIPTVQYSKFTSQSRLKFLSKSGPVMVSVPLINRSMALLSDLQIKEPLRFVNDFKKTLQSCYGRCDVFKELKDSLFSVLDFCADLRRSQLVGLNLGLCLWVFRVLGMSPEWRVYNTYHKDPNDRLIAISEFLPDTHYVCGEAGVKGYMDLKRFEEKGIFVTPQSYIMKPYKSLFGVNSDSSVSVLDPLFVLGIESTKKLIKG